MKSTETDLIQHALNCGLSPKKAREWAKEQLQPKPAPKPDPKYQTPPLFRNRGAL